MWWTIAVVVGLGLLVVGLLAMFGDGNPAISRVRGTVTSVTDGDHGSVVVCLSHAVDAGSTYGDRASQEKTCRDGVPEGAIPKSGDCVVLRSQGESPTLGIKRATGC